ncbi:MAG: hypothetical protein ABSH48_13895 [Verrucomicrobiota bacterium]|jgi:hypothetical protein
MKKRLEFHAAAGLLLATGGLFIAFLTARAAATTTAQPQRPAAVAATPVPLPTLPRASVVVARSAAPATGSAGVLDWRHQFALGMIETGNDDREIGGAGEVSRYQIMPSVWRCYSVSRSYRNPEVALAVARQHWAVLHDSFKQQAGREPTNFDMYVLWNTHHGYYAGRNFDPARLSPVVRDRAQRYVNLVQCGDTCCVK